MLNRPLPSCTQARLRFSHEVVVEDVEEAMRLMHASKDSVHDVPAQPRGRGTEYVTEIYRLILQMRPAGKDRVKMTDVEAACKQRGYKMAQLQECLDDYSTTNIWQITKDHVVFVH